MKLLKLTLFFILSIYWHASYAGNPIEPKLINNSYSLKNIENINENLSSMSSDPIIMPGNSDCSLALPINIDEHNANNWREVSNNTTDSGVHPSCYSSSQSFVDVWYAITIPANETGFQVILNNLESHTALWDSCGGTEIACDGVVYNTVNAYTGLTPGHTYYLQMYWVNASIRYHNFFKVEKLLPAPTNDNCNNAIAVNIYPNNTGQGNETLFSTILATDSGTHSSCASGSNSYPDLWYEVTLPAGETGFHVEMYKYWMARFTKMTLWDGCGGTQVSACGTSNDNNHIFTGLTPGQTYYLQIWSKEEIKLDAGFLIETLPDLPTNDTCSDAINLAVYPNGNSAGNELSQSNLLATFSGIRSSSCAWESTLKDLWYTVTVPAGETGFVVNFTDTFNHNNKRMYHALWDSCGGNLVSCGSYYSSENVYTGLTPGDTYYLQVWTVVSIFSDNYTIAIESLPSLPSNDQCSTPISLPIYPIGEGHGNELSQSFLYASSSGTTPSCQTTYSNRPALDLWYSITLDANQSAFVVILDQDNAYNSHLALYDTCGSAEITCIEGDSQNRKYKYTFSGLSPGSSYILQISDIYRTDTFDILLENVPVPTNTTCSTPLNLTVYPSGTGNGNEVRQSSILATDTSNAGSCVAQGLHSLWYSVTIPAGETGFEAFFTSPSYYNRSNFGVTLRDGCNGNVVDCYNGGSGAPMHYIFDGLTSGHTYIMQVSIFRSIAYYFDIKVETIASPPQNDDCSHAMPMTVYNSQDAYSNMLSQTMVYAMDSGTHPSCDNTGVNMDLWYEVTIPAGETGFEAIFDYHGRSIKGALWDSCGGNELACIDQGQRKLFTGLNSGQTYLLQLWMDDYLVDDFEIAIRKIPPLLPNDACAGAIPLSLYPYNNGTGNETVQETHNAYDENHHASCDTNLPNRTIDVWYEVTIPTSQTGFIAKFSGNKGDFVKTALWDACGGSEIACNTNTNHIYTGLQGGTTYYLQAWLEINNRGSFNVVLEELPTVPTNNDCGTAMPIPIHPVNNGIGNEIAQNLLLGSDSGVRASCNISGDSFDNWYSVTIPNGETGFKALFSGDKADYIKTALWSDCSANSELFCHTENESHIFTGLVSGQTYYLQVSLDLQKLGEYNIVLESLNTPPQNNTCAGAINLPFQMLNQGSANALQQQITFATDSGVHPGCDNVGRNFDLWYTVTIPQGNSHFTVKILSTHAELYEAALWDACNGNEISCQSYANDASFTGLTGGQTYYLQIWRDDNSNYGDFSIYVEGILPNDTCSNSLPLTVYPNGGSTGYEYTQSLVYATDSNTNNIIPFDDSIDVWYEITVPAGQTGFMTKTLPNRYGSHPNIATSLWDACNGNEIISKRASYDESQYFTNLTSGQTYYLQIRRSRFFSAEFAIAIEELPAFLTNDFCDTAMNLTVYPFGGGAGHEILQRPRFAVNSGMYGHSNYSSKDLWYAITVPAGEHGFSVNLPNTQVGSSLGLGLWDSCNGNEIAHHYFSEATNVFSGLTPGETYYLQVWIRRDRTSNFNIVVESLPTPLINDYCSGAISLPIYSVGGGAGHELSQSTTNAVDSGIYSVADSRPYNLDLWYEVTIPAGKTGFVAKYGGATGNRIEAALWDACGGNEVMSFTNASSHTFTGLNPNTTYYLQVWHDETQEGDFNIVLEDLPTLLPNDLCSGAISLPLYDSGLGAGHELAQSCANAINSGVRSSCISWGTYKDLWYSVTIPNTETGFVAIFSGAEASEIKTTLYDSCNGNEIDCQGRNNIHGFINLSPGTYLLKVSLYQTHAGNFNIVLEKLPQMIFNSDCDNAVELQVYPFEQSAGHELAQTNAYATRNSLGNRDLWYKVVLPPGVNGFKVIFSGDIRNVIYSKLWNSCDISSGIQADNHSTNRGKYENLSYGTTYYLQVWHSYNSIGNFNIVLEALHPTPPENDNCRTPTYLTVYPNGGSAGHETVQNMLYPTNDSRVATHTNCASNALDVWYAFTVPSWENNSISVKLTGVNADKIKTSLWSSCENELECSLYSSDQNYYSNVINHNTTYYLRVWYNGAYDDDFSIALEGSSNMPGTVPNDFCTGAIPLTGANNYEIGDIIYATDSGEMPAPTCANYLGSDIWYSVVVPANGEVTVETSYVQNSPITDTGMAIYSGTCGALSLLACDDDGGIDHFSRINLQGQTPGEILYIRLWDYGQNYARSNQTSTTQQVGITFYGNTATVENQLISGLQYYPNPAENVLNISTDNNIDNLIITNILGKSVFEVKPNSSRIQVDISNLTSGIYFVKLQVKGNTKTIKFVKK